MKGYIQNRKRLNFISYLRVFAVLCILECHLCNEAPIGRIQSLGQLFNIGVQIFLVISAFCFGRQGAINDIKKWYFKRIKRIVFPYETFFILLVIIYILRGAKLSWINWLSCIFFVQGMHVGVLGADHTWFMTTLVICYILTPFISEIWQRIQNKWIEKIVLIGLFIVPFVMAYICPKYIFIIIYHICFYAIAYYMGNIWDDFIPSKKSIIVYFIIMCMAFAMRFVGRAMFDGTRLYELIIVNYTHYIAAACIFMIFAGIFSYVKTIKSVEFIDSMSFEIYLCHYMFIVGPVSVMYITHSWIINDIIAICIAFLFAIILHRVSKIFRELF